MPPRLLTPTTPLKMADGRPSLPLRGKEGWGKFLKNPLSAAGEEGERAQRFG
jgi:hypothetical protein